jgi:intein/homing endonuclease
MADGSIQRIADVKIGDYVITQNDITGELQSREVEYVYKNLSVGNKLYEIELENGDRLKITGNHKVRLTSGQWMRVDELSIEDDICINSVR